MAIRIAASTKSFQPIRPSNFWKYHASISGIATFISSDGWKRMKPRLSQRREPLTTTPNSATPTSRTTASTYSGTAARASVCGGTFATSHISSRATARFASWPDSRAMLWSAAEYSVTSPTPTIAIAVANSTLSIRRVSASHSRARKSAISRCGPRRRGRPTPGPGPAARR